MFDAKIAESVFGITPALGREMANIGNDLRKRIILGDGNFDKVEIIDYLSTTKLTEPQKLILVMGLQRALDEQEFSVVSAELIRKLMRQD